MQMTQIPLQPLQIRYLDGVIKAGVITSSLSQTINVGPFYDKIKLMENRQ